MYDKEFKVKLISAKNCFIYLSEYDTRQVDNEHMIRLSYGLNKRAYFSLGTALSSLKEGELAMSTSLGTALGIIKNDIVNLSTTSYYASIRRLNLLCASQDDYEMLEVCSDNVQNTLLSQVKIVHNEQKLVIWISNSLHVTVTVDGVEPLSPGKLEMLTEVAILPPQQEINNLQNQYAKRQYWPSEQQSITNIYNQKQYTFCLQPLENIIPFIAEDKKLLIDQPFNVFLSRIDANLFDEEFYDDAEISKSSKAKLALVKLDMVTLPPDIADILNEVPKESTQSVIARLLFVDLPKEFEPLVMRGSQLRPLYANKIIVDYFHSKFGAKITVSQMKQLSTASFVPKSIDIITTKNYFSQADELVRNYLCSHCYTGGKLVVNSNIIMEEPTKSCRFTLAFNPPNESYLIIDSTVMRVGKFKLSEQELVDSKGDNNKSPNKPIQLCLDACNYKDILNGLDVYLSKMGSSAILTGGCGSGKTTLVKKFAENLSTGPKFTHVEYVSCKKLKGKNIDSLTKSLNVIFVRLVYYQPSLLILDDLHVICEKVLETDQPTQENQHFNKISEMLANELEYLTQYNHIVLLATAPSTAKLNSNIYNSRGRHLFKHCFMINDMDKNDRINVLKYQMKQKDASDVDVDFNYLGIKTEGFIMQDLLDLVDKVIFEVYKESIQENKLLVSNKHVESGLANMSALALRDVRLHSPGNRDFSDIGGLDEIKKILVETMLWPAQFANIFSHSPLRLQSGVLLYGPPGTGKTLLAGAAAKQCNLRLISVKGPELLSKYIGASEQAVRDAFQKAQRAKPCILFFDEFDSLAPRRGHDNTGVTDRVVNQFLTQLDGVESLNGVCVLAATSRPDLLDPALLRPGRLDRQLLCPMPEKKARLTILKALSKNLHLSEDIQLEKIAEATDGFTGADLQAVLYTAQLNSVGHLLENDSNLPINRNKGETHMISQDHLIAALRSTRPSLTKDERSKYNRIYQKFQGKNDILETLKSGKQKATLA